MNNYRFIILLWFINLFKLFFLWCKLAPLPLPKKKNKNKKKVAQTSEPPPQAEHSGCGPQNSDTSPPGAGFIAGWVIPRPNTYPYRHFKRLIRVTSADNGARGQEYRVPELLTCEVNVSNCQRVLVTQQVVLSRFGCFLGFECFSLFQCLSMFIICGDESVQFVVIDGWLFVVINIYIYQYNLLM